MCFGQRWQGALIYPFVNQVSPIEHGSRGPVALSSPPYPPQPEQRGPSQTGARRGDGVAEENPDDRGGAGGDLGADSYVCSNWATLS